MREEAPHLVPAVDRAIHILKAFASADAQLGVSELSRMLNLNKSTVFDILATLTHHQLLERDEVSRRYRLGPTLFHLGTLAHPHFSLADLARPFLQELTAVGMTAVLCAPDSEGRLRVQEATAPNTGLRLSIELGSPMSGEPLIHPLFYAPQSPADPTLQWVRDRGYVADGGHALPGICLLAVPVNDAAGRVVAALVALGLAHQLGEAGLDELLPALRQAGQRLSYLLGARTYPQWLAGGEV